MNRNKKITATLETGEMCGASAGTGEMSDHASAVHLEDAVKSKRPLIDQTARQGLVHIGVTYKATLLCYTYVYESIAHARNAPGVDLASSSRLNFDINLVTADLTMSGTTTATNSITTSNNKILPSVSNPWAKCLNTDFTAAMGQEHSVTGDQGTIGFHPDPGKPGQGEYRLLGKFSNH